MAFADNARFMKSAHPAMPSEAHDASHTTGAGAALATPVKPMPAMSAPAVAPKVRWKPNVTVAAIIERDGRFLLVEEETSDGLLLNNPAGHLDPGESPLQAVIRETLEETTCGFTPTAFLGMYMSRFRRTRTGEDTTYLRLAFVGDVGEADATLELDEGIVRTVWLTADEIRAQPQRLRSPLVIECIDAYLAGQRFPLDIVTVHESLFSAPSYNRAA
jgi:phosphatase NudJ